MGKYVFVLTRPAEQELPDFGDVLRSESGPAIRDDAPGLAGLRIVLREPATAAPDADAVDGADAVVELWVGPDHVPLDSTTKRLESSTSSVQGWRVSEEVVVDALGQDPRPVDMFAFIQRLDGTSPEFFATNWRIHGTGAATLAREQSCSWRYLQNRVLEPVTPTRWVIDGYGSFRGEGPSLPESDDPAHMPGEEPFWRVTSRLMLGRELYAHDQTRRDAQ